MTADLPSSHFTCCRFDATISSESPTLTGWDGSPSCFPAASARHNGISEENQVKFFRVALMVALILGLVGVVMAQSPMQFLSSTVRAGQPVPQKCLLEGMAIESRLALSPQRSGWVNIVACDEMVWREAMNRPSHIIRSQGDSLVDFTRHAKVFNAAEFPARRVKTVELRMAVVPAKAAPAPVAPATVPAM